VTVKRILSKTDKALSTISNDKKFSCVKSNLAIFNVDYVMSYPIYFK